MPSACTAPRRGVAERDGVLDKVDIVQATLAKAFGVVGGYIASTAATVDFVRSCGSGFIFTTSLPPAIAAAALASVRLVSSQPELRVRHQERAATLKRRLAAAGLPVMPLDDAHRAGRRGRCRALQAGERPAARAARDLRAADQLSRPCRAAPSACASRRRRCTATTTSPAWSRPCRMSGRHWASASARRRGAALLHRPHRPEARAASRTIAIISSIASAGISSAAFEAPDRADRAGEEGADRAAAARGPAGTATSGARDGWPAPRSEPPCGSASW